MKTKSKSPKTGQKRIAKEQCCSDSVLNHCRTDIDMNSPKERTPKVLSRNLVQYHQKSHRSFKKPQAQVYKVD